MHSTLKRPLLLGLALACGVGALTAAPEAKAEPEYRFIFSAQGPGQGEGVIGLGGRIIFIIPTFEVNYVRGLTDWLDLQIELTTLGIVNLGDVGLRFKLLGGADDGVTLGLRAGVTPMFAFIAFGETASGAVAIGATPGLVLSFGGRHVQFSLIFDAPIFFGGAGFVSGSGTSASASNFDPIFTGRPTLAIEFPVGDTVSMYISASGIISFQDPVGFFGPMIGLGAMW